MSRNESSQKGDYCELLVLARVTELGMQAAMPFGNQAGWDLLVFDDGQWQKWQVKTAYQRAKSGKSMYVDFIRAADRKNGMGGAGAKGYSNGDFDYLIAVFPETKEMWKLPVSECCDRRCKTFSRDKFVWEEKPNEADAKLIASAPDMLRIVERFATVEWMGEAELSLRIKECREIIREVMGDITRTGHK